MNRLVTFSLLAALVAVTATAMAADTPPVMDSKSCTPPQYPKASLMNEETGVVTLGLLVSAEGKVTESRIDKSSGHKNLDKAAVAGFSACRFKPGTKDGAHTAAWAKIDFTWALD
jgi:protein TonB